MVSTRWFFQIDDSRSEAISTIRNTFDELRKTLLESLRTREEQLIADINHKADDGKAPIEICKKTIEEGLSKCEMRMQKGIYLIILIILDSLCSKTMH